MHRGGGSSDDTSNVEGNDNTSDVETNDSEDIEDYDDEYCGSRGEASDESSLNSAISSAQDSSESVIRLTKDIELAGTVTINKSLRINLNGHNITAKDVRAFHIKSGYVTITGKGTISANKTSDSSTFDKDKSVIRVGDGAASTTATNRSSVSLSVDKDVTIASNHCYGISLFGQTTEYLSLSGKVSVTGANPCIAGNGTNGFGRTDIYLADGSELNCANSVAVYHPQGGTLTLGSTKITGAGGIEMKSGTLSIDYGATPVIKATSTEKKHKANSNNPSCPEGYAVAVVENRNYIHGGIPAAYLSTGTYTGGVAIISDKDAEGTTDAKDYSYTQEQQAATLQVTGDTYSEDPTAYLPVATGSSASEYKATKSGSSYVVTPNTTKAIQAFTYNGTSTFVDTLSDALNVEGVQAIKLLKDVTGISSTVEIAAGKDITLDLNGKTISGTVAGEQYNNGGIFKLAAEQTVTESGSNESYPQNASLVVTGNGKIENKATGYAPVFTALTGSFLSIEKGTYTSAGYGVLYANNSYVSIKVGSFSATHTDASSEKCAFYIVGSGTDNGGYSAYLSFEKGTLTGTKTYGIYVKDGGVVHLGDSEDNSGPTINSYWSAIAGNNTAATCNFYIYGGSYTAGHASTKTVGEDKENSVVFLPAKGTVEIFGGTFKTANSSTAAICVPYQKVGLSLDISGGTFDASNGDSILRTFTPTTPSHTAASDNTLSITGGSFKGAVTNFIGKTTTEGSSSTTNTNSYSAFISGGTFSKQPAADTIASGYTANYVNGAYTVAESSHVHQYSVKVTKAATCTEAGVETYTCTGDEKDKTSQGCGTSYTKAIAALGHKYTNGTITWTNNGTSAATAKFTCANDSKHTETVNATITKALTIKPKCEVKGTNTYTATATSSTGTKITATKTAQDEPALGHSYGPYTITKAPTTTATGVATAKCTHEGCTSTITKTVAKLASEQTTSAGGTNATVKVEDAKPVTTPNGTNAVGSVSLSTVSSTATKVSIPETVTINGAEYAVTSVDAKLFSGNTKVTSVSLPDTVTTIAEGQFKDCSALTSVTLPSSIKEIPANTFAGTALSSIGIPSKVTSIGDNAFEGTKLTSVSVPSSVTSIGANAFASTTSLKTVTLPSSVTTIGAAAFSGSAVESVSVPAAVKTIEADTFKDCAKLTSVTVGGATAIGENAFAGTSSLKTVTLPNTVTAIGKAAFTGSGIESINLPATVTTVEADTFKDCTKLKTIEAPKVTSIGENALNGCTALEEVTFMSAEEIGKAALSGCTGLKTVEVPKVTTIDADAFSGCTALTNVDAPRATTIDANAFKDCAALTEVYIPSALGIGKAALSGCTSLVSIDIPKATLIAADAFKGCTSLKRIALPSAKTVAKGSFSGCTALKTVTAPKVTRLVAGSFNGCTGLKTVNVKGAKTIAAGALSGCSALKTLTTGTKLTGIGKNALKGDSKLKTLTITSKKLSKKSVKGSLKGSAVTTIVVKVSGSKKTQEKYKAAYKKAFAKSNSGKKVSFK